jgi:osmotically-inducible protein OsmY
MASLSRMRPRGGAATTGQRAVARLADRRRGGWEKARSLDGPVVRVGALLAAFGAGTVAEHFFDREVGARRRHQARDRALAGIRRRSRDAVRRAKYLEGVAEGVAHKATHVLPHLGGEREQPDDVTLAQKVESVAFRKARVPTGYVSVNAENGVVYLRGQLESEEQIEKLAEATRGVEGVKGVKNLLHTGSTTVAGGTEDHAQ